MRVVEDAARRIVDQVLEVDVLPREGSHQELLDGVHDALGFDWLKVSGADAEGVDDDIVVAADEDVGGEDIDLVGGEAAGDFCEQARAVVVDDGELAATLVGFGLPAEFGGRGLAIAELGRRLFVFVDLFDIGGDCVLAAKGEVAGREAVEVADDRADHLFAEDGGHLDGKRAELRILFLSEAFGVLVVLAGGGVELADEGLLPSGPRFRAGAIGVGEAHHQQVVELLLVADDLGKLLDGLRVVDVAAGGGAVELQVVVDQEEDELAAFPFNYEPVAHFHREHGAGLVVMVGIGSAAGIMQDQREVEQEGIFEFEEQLLVELVVRLFRDGEFVEPVDGAQRVFVGRVAVVELVLDEVGESPELGDVAAEEADAVHLAEGVGDAADPAEDGLEGLAVGFAVAELAVDNAEVRLREPEQFRAEAQVPLLDILEHQHHLMRIF